MKYSYAVDKISKILRIEPGSLKSLCNDMEKICKKDGIMHQIIAENNFRVKEIINLLGVKKEDSSEIVYKAIINKLKEDDKKLYKVLGKPTCVSKEECGFVKPLSFNISGVKNGFFLKEKKACEMLCNYPPENIIKSLGYKDAEELLKKEDFREVFAALRFVESGDWMTNFLEKNYKQLNPSDFEERDIEIILLAGKWLDIAKKFIEKKYHNVSHLKELGIIFIIPIRINSPGETLRIFSLLLHYLHEIDFYSHLFKRYSKEDDFSKKLISALRGNVLEGKIPEGSWRIVQRYLAKDDVNDPRLFEPHVNPETIHWDKAERDLSKLDAIYPDLDFTFWKELNFVGDFFKAGKKYSNNYPSIKIKKNGEMNDLVSLNLIDNIMSLVKEKEMIKYLYHHQESLWNKIFIEYLSGECLERLMYRNFGKGYISEEEIKEFSR